MTYVTLASRDILSDKIYNFDNLRDRFNRQIGVAVSICYEKWVASEEQRWGGHVVEEGGSFFVAVHQVRNNEHYGSGYTSFRVKTLEEAQDKAFEFVVKRRKEYTKKYCQQ